MTSLPPSSHPHHRAHPPSQSSSNQPATPAGLSIATAVVRRLVREQSSYEVELAGQEARLRDLLLKRNKGEGRKEGEGRDDGEDGEDENWGYRVKQEEKAIEETQAVFGPLRVKILTATEKLEDMLKFETSKDEKEVQAAKDMVAMARQQMTKDRALTSDGES